MAGENILQTLQKLMAVADRVETLTQELREQRTAVSARLDRMEAQIADLRERVTRLETSRPADVAILQSEIARFQANLERLMLKMEREQEAPTKRLPKRRVEGPDSE